MQLVECPRDAMQGWPIQIATGQKVAYLNALLQVGFHTIDFGSFVSPKAVPQMADTREVLDSLQLEYASSKLLAIVANTRGAADAVAYEQIDYLGYPFSISPTFQKKNTNSTIEDSLSTLKSIRDLAGKAGKELVVYISMGFGNPYGDSYSPELLEEWAAKLIAEEVSIISLADTVGLATPQQVGDALEALIPHYPDVTFGVHLHATPDSWREKLLAALNAGCMRFDGAIMGIGGCPMSGQQLVGNMDTRNIMQLLQEKDLLPALNQEALQKSMLMAGEIFTS